MARYIDADLLVNKIFPLGIGDGMYTINAKALKFAIDSESTADVVEVVRCKDCEYGDTLENKGREVWCTLHDTCFGEDSYCSSGERKE